MLNETSNRELQSSELQSNELFELAVYKRLNMTSDNVKEISKIIGDIPLDRLKEICEAERNNILYIIPNTNNDLEKIERGINKRHYEILEGMDRYINELKKDIILNGGKE